MLRHLYRSKSWYTQKTVNTPDETESNEEGEREKERKKFMYIRRLISLKTRMIKSWTGRNSWLLPSERVSDYRIHPSPFFCTQARKTRKQRKMRLDDVPITSRPIVTLINMRRNAIDRSIGRCNIPRKRRVVLQNDSFGATGTSRTAVFIATWRSFIIGVTLYSCHTSKVWLCYRSRARSNCRLNKRNPKWRDADCVCKNCIVDIDFLCPS